MWCLFSLSFYVPQTAWIRILMQKHSQILGDDWIVDRYITEKVEGMNPDTRYPIYFQKPLHGFQDGGICKYQALYQSPSMRYIMRMFQGDPWFREVTMKIEIGNICEELCLNPTVIDIGCGTGDSTLIANQVLKLKRKCPNVIGVDLSPYMVEVAKLCTDLNFVQANAARLDMFEDDSVDLITSFALFHEMPRRYSICVLSEAYRLLKPGGRLLIWDQKVTVQSATTQACKGAPSIEPFLLSYSQLNITKWMMSKNMTHIAHSEEKFMQFWTAKL